tara:strand:- start:13935 stop:14528 length:594 start_codon:yes stop_codon:yes gene_type:complete
MKGSKDKEHSVRVEKNLTDAELQQKLDLYSQGGEKQFFKIQKIKNSYLDQLKEQQNVRSKSDINFALGVRSGLPHAPYESIKRYREDLDQKFRDQVIEEARGEYRKHQNLGKEFNGNNKSYEAQSPKKANKDELAIKKQPSLLKQEYNKNQTPKKTQLSPSNKRNKNLRKYFSGPSKGLENSSPQKARENRGMDRDI